MIKLRQQKVDDITRRHTLQNLERIQDSVDDKFDYRPMYRAFWTAIRSKDIECKVRDFLWMVTHDTYWTGTHWLRENMSQELKDRATCSHCGKIDDFRHILTECESPGQAIIWTLAGKLWKMKRSTIPWALPTLGDVLGCNLARISDPETGKVLTGETRLWRIIITQSVYLIWIMRCERLIANNNLPFSPEEVKNRWFRMIDETLEMDKKMTNSKYGKKATPIKLVLQTWKRTLKNEKNLPKDWISTHGVLVGISRGQDREEVSGVG